MPFKTTVNWLFNDIWCYLDIDCFDWKILVFQQTIVRVYYILNRLLKSKNMVEWTALTGARLLANAFPEKNNFKNSTYKKSSFLSLFKFEAQSFKISVSGVVLL